MSLLFLANWRFCCTFLSLLRLFFAPFVNDCVAHLRPSLFHSVCSRSTRFPYGANRRIRKRNQTVSNSSQCYTLSWYQSIKCWKRAAWAWAVRHEKNIYTRPLPKRFLFLFCIYFIFFSTPLFFHLASLVLFALLLYNGCHREQRVYIIE